MHFKKKNYRCLSELEQEKEANFIFSTFYMKQEPKTREIEYVHL